MVLWVIYPCNDTLIIIPEQKGIFLETAHPVKFPEAVEKVSGKKIEIPPSLADLNERKKAKYFDQGIILVN